MKTTTDYLTMFNINNKLKNSSTNSLSIATSTVLIGIIPIYARPAQSQAVTPQSIAQNSISLKAESAQSETLYPDCLTQVPESTDTRL